MPTYKVTCYLSNSFEIVVEATDKEEAYKKVTSDGIQIRNILYKKFTLPRYLNPGGLTVSQYIDELDPLVDYTEKVGKFSFTTLPE
jgi:hypothetical protein